METKTNDPMFPFFTYNEGGYGDTITFYDVNGSKQFFPFKSGLTKREYFAAMAMQSILSTIPSQDLKYSFKGIIPMLSVRYADMLIEELNKESNENK